MTERHEAVKRIVLAPDSMQSARMFRSRRTLLTALAAVVTLSGCAQDIYFREGATVSEVRRAEDACALSARQAAPFRPRTILVPGPIVPARKVCDGQGNCQTRPAYQAPPEFETMDANAERRVLIARTCMAERGFDRVSLPYCSGAVRNAAPAAVTRRLPRLTGQSCIIPRGQAGYQIVTPG
ncbi:hypothetical protein [Pseudooceanicola batsensis]|nr:hypothetical protein [Pseudooceanicola batsensis]